MQRKSPFEWCSCHHSSPQLVGEKPCAHLPFPEKNASLAQKHARPVKLRMSQKLKPTPPANINNFYSNTQRSAQTGCTVLSSEDAQIVPCAAFDARFGAGSHRLPTLAKSFSRGFEFSEYHRRARFACKVVASHTSIAFRTAVGRVFNATFYKQRHNAWERYLTETRTSRTSVHAVICFCERMS